MPITSETLRLVEELRRTIDRLADGTVRDLTAAWVRAWDTLAPEVVVALTELLAIGGDRWPTRQQILRASGTLHALDLVSQALEALAAAANTQIAAAAATGVQATAAGQAAVIASQLPAGITLATGVMTVPAEQLNAIVTRTSQQIHATTKPLAPDAVEAMKRELIRGAAAGDNPRETARRVLRRTEGEFNGGLARALNIARTEILDSHRAAAKASQEAAGDVLDGWVWTAELGPRTCVSCWAKHGTVYPLDEPGPLDHQSGRCARTPKTKTWRDLGFDIDEPDDLIPDAEQVFRGLPHEDQLQIMGAARLKLYSSGAITWGDLSRRRRTTDGWRDSYTPTPLRDLRPRT